jgi:hypothetical protein
MFFLFKIIFSAVMIAIVSGLASKKVALAGFLTALPLTSVLALTLSYLEFRDRESVVAYAQSIFFAVPLSLLFFVPFLMARKISLPYWGLFSVGLGLLAVGWGLQNIFVDKVIGR